MMPRFASVGCAAAFLALTTAAAVVDVHATGSTAAAAQDDDLAKLLPRIPPKSPAESMATFVIQHGFTAELVASEPVVVDPVDACFDEELRMYVAEMRDYPYSDEPRPQCPEGRGKKLAGVVRRLVDADGDGRYESSTVFADQIEWPTSVVCYKGGVFVAAAPHLWYFRDNDGDGVAEQREIVWSGFSRANVQGLVNNLKWGLDNRIHGAGGLNGGALTHRGERLFDLGGSDLIRFDPRTETLEKLSGGSQFGHSFDDWGNRFVCSNSNHLQQVVLPHRYLARNPYLPVPAVTQNIAKEGGAAPVFRKSQPEPWRLVRTRRRAADPELSQRLPMSELVPTGFFTSATGATVYRGGAYPPEFLGTVFIGDVGGNLIHRKRLAPNGLAFSAARAEPDTEFLTATDNWFRPANFVNAPDGTLYVLDMYRETIEHPFSIPEDIKAHLDLESGDDRGRIYRLVAPGMPRVPPEKLGGKTPAELAAALASPHAWCRETAQRLIVERQSADAVPHVRALLRTTGSALGRLHALWTLRGLDALETEDLLVGLRDPHPGVRKHAVELAESSADPAVWNALEARIDDDDARVRVQLAFSLGEIRSPAADAALAKLIRRHGSDAELRTAWLTSIAGKEAALFRELWADDEFAASAGGAALLAELAGVAGARNDAQAAGELLGLIAGRGEAPRQGALIQALARGLARAGASISEIVNRPTTSEATRRSVERLFARMAEEARDERRPVEARAAAILRMGYDPAAETTGWLEEWLSPQTPPPLQIAAVQALGLRRGEAEKVGARLIEHWGRLSPAVRKEAVEVLSTRPASILELLAAVEEGRVRPGEIERDKRQLLLNFPQEQVRTEARRVLGQDANSDRAKVIAQYQPALEKPGNAERGRELFRKHCAACHQAGDLGKPVGPNLASVANKSPGDLLISILDPNREALPQYTNYTVVTDQGTTISGIIAAETATSLTLRRAEGAEDVILRSNVAELVSSGETLMPIGFEKDVAPEQMADLIEFVRTIKEAPAGK